MRRFRSVVVLLVSCQLICRSWHDHGHFQLGRFRHLGTRDSLISLWCHVCSSGEPSLMITLYIFVTFCERNSSPGSVVAVSWCLFWGASLPACAVCHDERQTCCASSTEFSYGPSGWGLVEADLHCLQRPSHWAHGVSKALLPRFRHSYAPEDCDSKCLGSTGPTQ